MRRALWIGAGALAVTLASCTPKRVPPPPPPPPPVVVIPPRPVPPDGASPVLVTPPVDEQGVRESVNRKISSNQLIWNLRSAYTVAALGCHNPRHAQILPRYKLFLSSNVKPLKAVYDEMDRDFRQRYGRGGESMRDDYLTTLYNHYALPPTMPAFCDVIDQVMRDGEAVTPDQLGAFAQQKVPVIEQVFDDFYARYDQYKNALAEWEDKYGTRGRVRIEPLAADGTPLPPSPPAPLAPGGGAVPVRAPTYPPASQSVQGASVQGASAQGASAYGPPVGGH